MSSNNFSFSHSIFYPFKELSPILIKSKIVVCKLFQFGTVQNSPFGKGVTLYHTILTLNDPEKEHPRKTLWKKVTMLVTSIFPFSPQCFLAIPNHISIFESNLWCCLLMPPIYTSEILSFQVKS